MRSGPFQPLAAVAVALLAIPLVALVVDAPWGSLLRSVGDPAVRSALLLSVVTASISTVVVALLGVPLGWVLARDARWARIRPVVLVPLVLPPVVGGVALQLAWGRDGLVGGPLHAAFGLVIPFSMVAVVLAQVFVALPFCVLAVETAVRAVDPRMEEMALVHGMEGTVLFRRVTLPLAAPGVIAGLAVAWARALGEFGATITFAGNLPGRTQTMPLAVFLQLQSDPPAAILLSLILLTVSLLVLVSLRGRLGLGTS